MNEIELIKKVQAGDDLSFTYLIERYWIGLIIYCERLVNDREEAEDIAQNSCIKAYTNIKYFDPAKSRYSTWLYRIAQNTAIDYLRSSKRTAVYDDELQSDTSSNQVHEAAESAELQDAVRAAIQLLQPDAYRKVIEGYYWQGKSYQILADELGVPVNTIKTWIHRAKLQLKEKL